MSANDCGSSTHVTRGRDRELHDLVEGGQMLIFIQEEKQIASPGSA